MSERCDRTVSISMPCALTDGHLGVCQADHVGQLRLYGVEVEELRELQRVLAEGQRLGIVRGQSAGLLRYTSLGKYVRLRSELERRLPRDGGRGLVRTSSIRDAIAFTESFELPDPTSGRTAWASRS